MYGKCYSFGIHIGINVKKKKYAETKTKNLQLKRYNWVAL